MIILMSYYGGWLSSPPFSGRIVESPQQLLTYHNMNFQEVRCIIFRLCVKVPQEAA